MADLPDLSAYPGAHWRELTDQQRELYSASHWVCADVTIRRVCDGVERVHVDGIGFPSIVGMKFWWSDGNGGCDCNRRLFFYRAGGEEHDDDTTACTHGEFVIVAPPWLADAGTDD